MKCGNNSICVCVKNITVQRNLVRTRRKKSHQFERHGKENLVPIKFEEKTTLKRNMRSSQINFVTLTSKFYN